ncbi:MAG: DUF1501 domain-containing protein [Planctomycetia bacterium]|nr:DUF1501 domain-containing protein [Planctomycetia bacterium]
MSKQQPTRRDFIRTAAAGAAGLALADVASGALRPPLALGKAKSCIFINMVGGPAHLDTFDPKPDAPSDVRGPFKPIQTKVPGIHLSELFPRLANLTDKFSLIRSMHHNAPPVHECGFQLLNTGHLFRDGPEWPNAGAIAAYLLGPRALSVRTCSWGVLPFGSVSTGITVSHGLSAAWLADQLGPTGWEFGSNRVPSVMERIEGALSAIRLGGRFVTVNTYSTVFDSPSWDCHADGGSLRTTLTDIRDTVAPSFDTAFAALIADLEARGLFDSTLVVATGEFGRTPKLNSNGGRDHWAGCWTALVAGGGVKGGQIIGRSDRIGSEPAERSVSPQELVASIFHALGVPHDATIPGPDGSPVAVYPAAPVAELF